MTSAKDFRDIYLQFLIKDWTDEAFSQRIDSDPRGALAEVGLELPADVSVQVVRHVAGEVNPYAEQGNEAALDVQATLYEKGLESGVLQLHLPAAPAADSAELSESDLTEVAAGEVPCCCCCC